MRREKRKWFDASGTKQLHEQNAAGWQLKALDAMQWKQIESRSTEWCDGGSYL